MAKDILGEAGLHFDELNKLRVLDPEVTQQTIELKEECKDFVDSECHLGRHGATQLCAPPPPPDCSFWPCHSGAAGSQKVEPGLHEFPCATHLVYLPSCVVPEHQSKQTLQWREEGICLDMPSQEP